MYSMKKCLVNFALSIASTLLFSNSAQLIAEEYNAPQKYSCPSGQCGLPNNTPQTNSCPSGQCGLPSTEGGQPQCPHCHHKGPNYGYNPGWEAGIEVIPHNCPSCQNGYSNRPRFLPDSDSNSYDYYNYYESDCYPQ